MSDQKDIPELDLINLLRQDDQLAMSLIFKEHYTFVCRAINRLISDPHQAEDIAQDVFFDLWKRRDILEISTSLRAYLRRAGINKTLNFIRDRKLKWDDEDKLPMVASSVPDATKDLEGQDLQLLVDEIIDSLPERCRLVFTLSRFEEMTNQQIADELDISIKTVENQMTKALRVMRTGLDPFLKRR